MNNYEQPGQSIYTVYWGEPQQAPPYEVNSEISLLACLLDTASLIWLKDTNQNYIKLEWYVNC